MCNSSHSVYAQINYNTVAKLTFKVVCITGMCISYNTAARDLPDINTQAEGCTVAKGECVYIKARFETGLGHPGYLGQPGHVLSG